MQQKRKNMNMKEKEFNEMEYDIPDEIDFKDAIRSPYSKILKQQVTINLSKDVIEYFKNESKEVGISYQTLINLYLMDCANKQLKLKIDWK